MKHFLITTIHNKQTRWDRIREHLDHNGIDYTAILAPDWKMFVHTGLNPAQYKQQSLTLAYYQIAQTALFEGIDSYVVIEDDVKLNTTTHPLWLGLPEDADFAYLTRTEHNRLSAETIPVNDQFSEVLGNWWETPLTLWSRRFASAFADHIASKLTTGLWLGHIDHELLQLLATGQFRFYGATSETAIGLSNNPKAAEASRFDTIGSITEDTEATGVGA